MPPSKKHLTNDWKRWRCSENTLKERRSVAGYGLATPVKEDLWHATEDGMLWQDEDVVLLQKSLKAAIDQTMEFNEQRENKSMPF